MVIVTHAHKYDETFLQALVELDLGYLGMIGSRRKVRIILENLRKSGVPEGKITQVRSPIGLAIGAETPEEIAVSILAEIVLVRQGSEKDDGRAMSAHFQEQ